MAKTLKNYPIRVANESGDTIEFDAQVYVSDRGVFAVTFPDEYRLDIEANLKEGCVITKPRKFTRVEGVNMAMCIESIEEGLNSILTTTVTNELVIWYQFATECHYAVDKETGQLYSNAGAACDITGKNYGGKDAAINWADNGADCSVGASWRKTLPYMVGIQAAIYVKTTYSSSTNSKVRYKRMSYAHPDDGMGHYAKLLAGFNHISFKTENGKDGNATEIPYSEEAAKFFHDAMLAICALSHKLTDLFSKEGNVAQAIANGTKLLGGTRR